MDYPIRDEFVGAELGDARRTRRLVQVAERLGASPTSSFPQMFEDDAELQGAYGLFENEDVDEGAIRAAHVAETLARIDAEGSSLIRVIHDTTTFTFGGEVHRAGMGWLGKKTQGFIAHFSLAVSADESRRPLGVLALSTIMRAKPSGKARRHGRESAKDPLSESRRWLEGTVTTRDLLRGHALPIHIMDCEADSYALFGKMLAQGQRFVIRVREKDRPVELPDGEGKRRVAEVARCAPSVATRTVALGHRAKSPLPAANKKHPPRAERPATLEFAATTVRIRRPSHLDPSLPIEIEVNVVHIREVEAPEGAEPVEWLLYTTEAVETAEDILRVVDHYRARWLIEEYFKAIKTGCEYEARQLDSAHALLIALAISIPVAWQMLLVRHQARTEPDAAALSVITPHRLEVLRLIAARKAPLPQHPTARDVLYSIAGIGGHIKWGGPPGWQTLSRGMQKLLFAEHVLAAQAQQDGPTSDQS